MGIFNWNKKRKQEMQLRRIATQFTEEEIREACDCAPASRTAESLTFQSLLHRNFSYRSISAVYACIEIISNAMSSMPLRVMKEDEHGHKEFVRHHPLQRIFNNKNIQMMSIQSIIKCVIQDVLIHGNGYILIERGETGLVNALRYIPAGQVGIEYNQNNNTLCYWISLLEKSTTKHKYDPKDVIHVVKDTRDGITGVPVSSFAKDTIDLTKAAEEAAKMFFDSGMNVSGLLMCKSAMTEKQRGDILSSWVTGDKHTLHILPLGVDYQALGTDAAKGQLLESRQYQTIEIARYYGVPAQFLQSADKVTYTAGALEQLNLIFFQQTLLPFISSIESEFTRKLFYDSDEYVVDMDETAFLLRTDKSTTSSYLSTLVGGGIMTVNEARRELSLSEAPDGDQLHIAYSDASKAKIGNENERTEDETNE